MFADSRRVARTRYSPETIQRSLLQRGPRRISKTAFGSPTGAEQLQGSAERRAKNEERGLVSALRMPPDGPDEDDVRVELLARPQLRGPVDGSPYPFESLGEDVPKEHDRPQWKRLVDSDAEEPVGVCYQLTRRRLPSCDIARRGRWLLHHVHRIERPGFSGGHCAWTIERRKDAHYPDRVGANRALHER